MPAKRMRSLVSSQSMAIATRAKELKTRGVDVISLSVGEPDFDTPIHIKNAAIQAIQAGFTKYSPAEGIPELRQAVTNKINEELGLSYDWTQTVISNGSKQALYNFFQAVVEKGDEVIIPAPYWLSYPAMVQLAGGRPKIVQTTFQEGFKLTPSKLKKALSRKTRALVLNSPSNPTGAVYSKTELEGLARVLGNKNIWVVSDEAYYKLIYEGISFCSMAQISKRMAAQTLIFRTCSKSYAMTGWRVGSVTGPLDIIRAIGVVQSHATSGVNSIAQKAAVVAFVDVQSEDCVKAMVKEFDHRRLVGLEALAKISHLDCFRPEGAFYFFVNASKYFGKKHKGNVIRNSTDMATFLLDKARVAVVPGGAFGADHYLRLSFAASSEILRVGISRIGEALATLKSR